MADGTETIGKFQFSTTFAKPAAEKAAGFDRRADTLAAWLLARWIEHNNRKEGAHDDRKG